MAMTPRPPKVARVSGGSARSSRESLQMTVQVEKLRGLIELRAQVSEPP